MGSRKYELSLISIIVPIYNSEKFLSRLIDSILCQTYSNIEIILINDGSTDGSAETCIHFANKDSRIIFLDQKNSGVSNARNAGIECSSGECLLFVDSDDILPKIAVDSLYNSMVVENSDIVIGSYVKKSNFKETTVQPNASSDKLSYVESILRGREHSAMWNKLVSRDVIGEIRFDINLTYMEDQVFFLELLQKNVKLSFIKQVVYFYILHPEACTSKMFQNSLSSRIYAVHIICSIYSKKTSQQLIVLFKANCIYFLILNNSELARYAFPEISSQILSNKLLPYYKKAFIWFYINEYKRVLCFLKLVKSKLTSVK